MSIVTSSGRSDRHFGISAALVGVAALVGLAGSAQGTIYNIVSPMDGLQETPPNASPASGLLTGSYDDATNSLSFSVNWSGLTAGTTAAHFHGPAPVGTPAGVQIGWTGFPTGVTSGTYSNTFALSAAQESDLLGGLWYSNVHTQTFPGGEIRGQLFPVVPEPATLSVLGLIGVSALMRRR